MSIVGDDCNTCVFVTIDPVMFQYYNLALVQLTFIVLQLNRRVGSFVTLPCCTNSPIASRYVTFNTINAFIRLWLGSEAHMTS